MKQGKKEQVCQEEEERNMLLRMRLEEIETEVAEWRIKGEDIRYGRFQKTKTEHECVLVSLRIVCNGYLFSNKVHFDEKESCYI